jgi:hypothetical protein
MDAQDYLNFQMRAMSPTPEKLDESRRTIVCSSDWVLPGHGPMFQVTVEHKRAFNCSTFGNDVTATGSNFVQNAFNQIQQFNPMQFGG